MIHTLSSTRGMVVAPHHLAAQSGLSVLREGGNAVEAMVAAAATIAVVYPHMNSIGGDGFWLIRAPGKDPVAICASGAVAHGIDAQTYRDQGAAQQGPTGTIKPRGPQAALTVAGTVAGWQRALEWVRSDGAPLSRGHAPVPESRLLEDAIRLAREGYPIGVGQAALTNDKRSELQDIPGFSDTFLPGIACDSSSGSSEGHMNTVVPGMIFRQPVLAELLRMLSSDGFDSFYRGEASRIIAQDLEEVGSPIDLHDLQSCEARLTDALSLRVQRGIAYNTPPPTQGLSSLAILGMFDRLYRESMERESFEHIHTIVEATRRAFADRDSYLCDPAQMVVTAKELLASEYLDRCAAEIGERAGTYHPRPLEGDTVYLAAVDSSGLSVSFIQSLYWEFGSGVVLPRSGVLWQNRGVSFSLDPGSYNALRPGALPKHTLNPAIFLSNDGATTVYGTMGGDGQPQTQAALITRTEWFGRNIQEAISAPRWLYGRTWGDESTTLKLEGRFPEEITNRLLTAGHDVERLPDFDSRVGHAAAIRRRADGVLEGGVDPRADGAVAAW